MFVVVYIQLLPPRMRSLSKLDHRVLQKECHKKEIKNATSGLDIDFPLGPCLQYSQFSQQGLQKPNVNIFNKSI